MINTQLCPFSISLLASLSSYIYHVFSNCQQQDWKQIQTNDQCTCTLSPSLSRTRSCHYFSLKCARMEFEGLPGISSYIPAKLSFCRRYFHVSILIQAATWYWTQRQWLTPINDNRVSICTNICIIAFQIAVAFLFVCVLFIYSFIWRVCGWIGGWVMVGVQVPLYFLFLET